MVTDAYVKVSCDGCGAEEEIQLTATARSGWDERNVKKDIERLGWKETGDNAHSCGDCLAKDDEEDVE